MATKIAINGFGRIGRLTFRQLIQNPDLEVVAVNDLSDTASLAHLLKYDTSHGKLNEVITHDDDSIQVGNLDVKVFARRDPEQLPWKELGIDIVLECTGFFRKRDQAAKHITAGAKRVIISAPAKSEGVPTLVIGVNDKEVFAGDHDIISNASCTTNCLAPVIKLIDQKWGLKSCMMTTVHAYTANQNLQDGPHKDLRRSRAAAENIIPTTTGAAEAVEIVYPEVKGKIKAMAFRVPVATGSLCDLTFDTEKPCTSEEINALLKEAAQTTHKGIIEFETDPIVSKDIVTNPHSSIIDSLLTSKQGDMHKLVTWYDNEYGYSSRLADATATFAASIK